MRGQLARMRYTFSTTRLDFLCIIFLYIVNKMASMEELALKKASFTEWNVLYITVGLLPVQHHVRLKMCTVTFDEGK